MKDITLFNTKKLDLSKNNMYICISKSEVEQIKDRQVMKAIKQTIYDSVDEYEKVAKVGDIIVLAGNGIIDGVEGLSSKHDTYKVSRIKSDGSISIKGYRGRSHLAISACAYNQKVLLLTKKEFNKLPILW